MDNRQRMIDAGRWLRLVREELKLTQRDVERLTAERWGWEDRTCYQEVQRIENGELLKPPIIDLLHIAEVYGLTHDDIGERYGLWKPNGTPAGACPQDGPDYAQLAFLRRTVALLPRATPVRDAVLPRQEGWLRENARLQRWAPKRRRTARRMWVELRRMGIAVAESTVRQLVRERRARGEHGQAAGQAYVPLAFAPSAPRGSRLRPRRGAARRPRRDGPLPDGVSNPPLPRHRIVHHCLTTACCIAS